MNKTIMVMLLLASISAALPLADVATLEKNFSYAYAGATVISLTFDGTNYWMIDGGYTPSTVTKFDSLGNQIEQGSINLDGRSIAYNPNDGKLYIKDYQTNSLYTLGALAAGAYGYAPVAGFSNAFQDKQSKITLSSDGQYVYDALNGKVRKYQLSTGANVENITLAGYSGGFPEEFQIATDGTYLFALKNNTILAYNLDGSFVKEITGLPNPANLFYIQWSYSHADNKIWVWEYAAQQWMGYGIYLPEEPVDAPMFPTAAMPLGIMAATLAGAYGMARKN